MTCLAGCGVQSFGTWVILSNADSDIVRLTKERLPGDVMQHVC